MAYSSMNADAGAEEDEPAVLGSGGAIMAALEQKDPAIKSKVSSTKKVKVAPKKPFAKSKTTK